MDQELSKQRNELSEPMLAEDEPVTPLAPVAPADKIENMAVLLKNMAGRIQ